MTIKFDIDKIVKYLERYKFNLPELYSWNANIDRLVELNTLTDEEVDAINTLTPFEKELKLKKIVGSKLNETLKSNTALFDKLCLWVIKDWGGITTANDNDTVKLIWDFLNKGRLNFNRIASVSKVLAHLYPSKNIIYDSRVAYALNWIILSEDAGKQYFPIPEGRNSKMSAFDLNVLIRVKNISIYRPQNIEQLKNRRYIANADNNIFISKKVAYTELNNLIKTVNERLWKGFKKKERNLYYTEMLLFSIADREVFLDITNRYLLKAHELG